jgi:hypothetical protein
LLLMKAFTRPRRWAVPRGCEFVWTNGHQRSRVGTHLVRSKRHPLVASCNAACATQGSQFSQISFSARSEYVSDNLRQVTRVTDYIGSDKMNMNLRKFTLAILTVMGLSIGSIAAMTAPASAHVVCDDDGDDCWRTHPAYYDRGWNHEWRERREWEERRERDAYRRRYWDQPRYRYDWDRGYSGGGLWFNF